MAIYEPDNRFPRENLLENEYDKLAAWSDGRADVGIRRRSNGPATYLLLVPAR